MKEDDNARCHTTADGDIVGLLLRIYRSPDKEITSHNTQGGHYHLRRPMPKY